MYKHVGLDGLAEKVVEVEFAELRADDSPRVTSRRGVLGASNAGLTGFGSGSAHTSWVDTSGA